MILCKKVHFGVRASPDSALFLPPEGKYESYERRRMLDTRFIVL